MSTPAIQTDREIKSTESPSPRQDPPVSARRAVSAVFLINGTLGAGWATRIPAIQQHLHLDPRALGLALLGAAVGFGLVGAGFSAIFPIVLSAAGRARGMASGNAIAAVATCGYVGYLIGPPSIGFIAQAASLRAALTVVVILSLVAAILAPVVRPHPTGH